MAIPSEYLISESGQEYGERKKFRGTLTYAIPQAQVEGYRDDFTPGLISASVTTTADVISSAGVVTIYTADFAASMIGQPITFAGVGTYAITDYTSTQTVDTNYTGATDITSDTAVTIADAKTYPGKSGILAARLKRYKLRPEFPGFKGMAKLTMDYETPSINTLLQESTARAILEIDVVGHQEAIQREWPDSRVEGSAGMIEGISPYSSDLGTTWKVVQGSNITFRPGLTMMKVRTAASEVNLTDMKSKIGCVNDRTVSNLGNAGTGHVMFVGPKVVSELPMSDFFLVDWYFAYDSGQPSAGYGSVLEPWECRTQRHVQVARKVDVYSGDVPASPANTKYVGVLIPKPGTGGTAVVRSLSRGSANFGVWNGMLEWTNEF